MSRFIRNVELLDNDAFTTKQPFVKKFKDTETKSKKSFKVQGFKVNREIKNKFIF